MAAAQQLRFVVERRKKEPRAAFRGQRQHRKNSKTLASDYGKQIELKKKTKDRHASRHARKSRVT